MSIKKIAMMLFAAVMIYSLSGKAAFASEDANTNSEISAEYANDAGLEAADTSCTVIEDNADSNVVKNTVTAAGKTETKKKKYSKADLRLMASIINCEAGAERYQGKVAVGIVVMNRVKSKNFPNSVRKVIYQKFQFSPVRNGMLRKKLAQYDKGKTNSAQWKACISAAKKALNGQKYVIMNGKKKSMSGIKYFSVGLSNPKFRLGGHRFK